MSKKPKYKNIFLVNASERETLSDKRAIEMMGMAQKVSVFGKGNEALMCLMQPGNMPEIIIASEKMRDMDITSFLSQFAHLPRWVSGFCKVYLLLPKLSAQTEEQNYRHYKISKTLHRPLCVHEIPSESNTLYDFLN